MRSGRLLLSRCYKATAVILDANISRGVTNTLRILEVAFISQALGKGGTDVNKALSGLSIKLDEHIVTGVIKSRGLDVEKTLNFFIWAGCQNGYKHTPKIFAAMIWRLCRAGKLEMVPSIMDEIKENGYTLDTATSKLLLRSFIKSGMFDNALEILDTMEKRDSNQLNPELYNSILVDLLKKSEVKKAYFIFNIMLKGNIKPYTTMLNQLLVSLRKSNMMAEFEKTFWDSKNIGCDFDGWTYSICIHAFGIVGGKVSLVEKLFEEMKEKGCPLDVCIYNCYIAALCKVGKLRQAMNMMEEMKAQSHEPDGVTYGTLIRGLCRVNKISDALKLFDEMIYNGCNPELIVYNSLLDGLFKVGKVENACQFFEKMVQQGVVPNFFSYNILIDGLFKKGRAEAAYKLFDDLKKKRQCVDSITYSIVISYFCKNGRIEDSLGLLEEMEFRGLVPDMVTITSLLIALHKSGRRDWARQLMKRIGDSSVFPDIVRWSTEMEPVIKSRQEEVQDLRFMFVKNDNVSRGLHHQQLVSIKEKEGNICQDQSADNCELKLVSVSNEIGEATQLTAGKKHFSVNLFSSNMSANNVNTMNEVEDPQNGNEHADNYNVLADHINGAGGQDTSEKTCDIKAYPRFLVFKGRRIQGRGMDSFNINMFNTYMYVLSEQGKVKMSCRLFQDMIDNGHEPGTYTYNTLLTVFVKKGYLADAWGLFLEMGRKLCFADIATYNLVIDSLGKMGETNMAHLVLDTMLTKGGYLDIVMYNTLIKTAGKGGRFDEANKLFRGMTADGLTPDVVTYNTLIELYSKAGKLKEAYHFLRMMIDAGCSPNHVTDTILDFLEKQIEKLRYQKATTRTNEKP